MYFLDTDKKGDLYQLVKHILKGDKIGLQPHEEIPEMDPPPPPRKKRAVFAEVGADISTQLNCANPNHTLYQLFEEQLITEGTIKWRLHSENRDICVMNDIKHTTGHLMPQSFVHVECTKPMDEELYIKCTCKIYNLIQRAALQEAELLPGEEIVPDSNLTCMHCRFYREHLLDVYAHVTTQPTTSFTRAHHMILFSTSMILYNLLAM